MIFHRERLLQDIQAKRRKIKEVAEILNVKRETVSRWLARYRFSGLDGILPRKPGPKKRSLAVNRTAKEVEEVVCLVSKLNPWDEPQYNGKIERYHRTFKEKECSFWSFTGTPDELNYRLALWVKHYNFKKKHAGLNMHRLTPAQKLLYASFQKPMQAHLQNVTGTLQLNNN